MITELDRLFEEYLSMKAFLPGKMSQQYNICGNQNCRCKDKENPRKHGPQHRLSYATGGKNSTKYVKKVDFKVVQDMNDRFRRNREIMTNISLEAMSLFKEKGPEAVQRQMDRAISRALAKAAGVKDSPAKAKETERSRDKWKAKAKERALGLRISDLSVKDIRASRDKWREEALALREETCHLKALNENLSEDSAARTELVCKLEEQLKKR